MRILTAPLDIARAVIDSISPAGRRQARDIYEGRPPEPINEAKVRAEARNWSQCRPKRAFDLQTALRERKGQEQEKALRALYPSAFLEYRGGGGPRLDVSWT